MNAAVARQGREKPDLGNLGVNRTRMGNEAYDEARMLPPLDSSQAHQAARNL
jgi:hypothetical protein